MGISRINIIVLAIEAVFYSYSILPIGDADANEKD